MNGTLILVIQELYYFSTIICNLSILINGEHLITYEAPKYDQWGSLVLEWHVRVYVIGFGVNINQIDVTWSR